MNCTKSKRFIYLDGICYDYNTVISIVYNTIKLGLLFPAPKNGAKNGRGKIFYCINHLL